MTATAFAFQTLISLTCTKSNEIKHFDVKYLNKSKLLQKILETEASINSIKLHCSEKFFLVICNFLEEYIQTNIPVIIENEKLISGENYLKILDNFLLEELYSFSEIVEYYEFSELLNLCYIKTHQIISSK